VPVPSLGIFNKSNVSVAIRRRRTDYPSGAPDGEFASAFLVILFILAIVLFVFFLLSASVNFLHILNFSSKNKQKNESKQKIGLWYLQTLLCISLLI
jgi:hypothetical protein